jgi:LacI family transcriptional regulator
MRKTIHDVAQRAGVSITTVSRTINMPSLVDPATAAVVRSAIEELKYFPDSHARSLVSGKSRILGLIVSDITNPFFPELVKGFSDAVVSHGYDILVSSTNYDSSQMALSVRRMLERKVDGVAIMTTEMDESLIDPFSHRKVPLVFLDVGTVADRISNIVVDYESGIDEAVDHLVALGHRRIGFISGPLNLKSARIRKTAFLRSLSRYGISEDDRLVQEGDHKVGGGLAAMERMLQVPVHPTAVLASNDLTAFGMMRAVRRAGMRVPQDISVVGFDDIWLAEFMDPPLTTVRLSREEIAQLACRALLDDLAKSPDPRQQREFSVETHLIIRESTARVPAPAALESQGT